MSTFGFQSEKQRINYDTFRTCGWWYSHTEPTGEIIMEHREIHGDDSITTNQKVMIGIDGQSTA